MRVFSGCVAGQVCSDGDVVMVGGDSEAGAAGGIAAPRLSALLSSYLTGQLVAGT